MNGFFGEYGSFLVELIAGASTLGVIALMWPVVGNFMNEVAYLLI